jgi:purine-binding chemotaxis protein CheW
MNALTPVGNVRPPTVPDAARQLVTFLVNEQIFGLNALRVRDVLREQPLTRIPLAKPEIAGLINLRGHIVTAIDVRSRLGVPAASPGDAKMCVVVEKGVDAFCLMVDGVGDVISVKESDIEPNPASLPPTWSQFSRGLFRMENKLLLLLDVDQLLSF